MRCFVAIDVSPAVRAALNDVLDSLRAGAPRADVRWVDPGKLHLTLKFLGTVPEERVPAISHALEDALADFGPVALSVPLSRHALRGARH